MSRKLDDLIAEAKSEEPAAIRELDWSKIEARLMDEAKRETAHAEPGAWRRKYLRPATVALTLAATFIIYARREAAQQVAVQGQPNAREVAVQREEASALTSGELRIDGAPLGPGQVVRAGDALSVTNGRAVLERAKAVSWLVETADTEPARARVSSAGQQGEGPAKPLVIALEHGAIEAQVTPVKAGEAFAVDVAAKTGTVRIAVHGTHLRVARAGDRVVVDLTEGVIAIGAPPAAGVTSGTSVTAPAHVELDANDLGTLRVQRTSVRPPVQLGDHVVVMEEAPSEAAGPALVASAAPVVPKTPLKAEAPKPAVPPREAIVAAVRQCAAKHSKTGGEVRVSVTSELSLTVGSDGMPKLAQFTPPLPPDVQACAAETIYKTKLDETGAVSVPLSFSY